MRIALVKTESVWTRVSLKAIGKESQFPIATIGAVWRLLPPHPYLHQPFQRNPHLVHPRSQAFNQPSRSASDRRAPPANPVLPR